MQLIERKCFFMYMILNILNYKLFYAYKKQRTAEGFPHVFKFKYLHISYRKTPFLSKHNKYLDNIRQPKPVRT